MNLHVLRAMLAWCTVINLAILLIWGILLRWAHDWVYGIHAKWFRMPVERFDTFHYGAMGAYKLGILLFNLVPYLVLRFIL
jgi:hypothetical protein